MENLSRFSVINQQILNNVDNKTLVNFNKASRIINQVLDKEKFYWIRIINNHSGRFQDFQEPWKKVIFKTPVGTVKQLALAVHKFFQGIPTRIEKQWHPLFIAADQGSLELCEHIANKTGDKNPKI